jgi:transaldolase
VTVMGPDPLAEVAAAGVSLWLDDLGRARLTSGSLAGMVADSHVTGVTSNPSIFHKSIGEGGDYADDLRRLAAQGASAQDAVRELTGADVRGACDVLSAVYERTGGHDGFVSLEVDPRLAHDTDATVAQAAALWSLVDRPNLMVKIPATLAGLPAITATLRAGINVNVTLIFGLDRYSAVMDAWLAGLEQAKSAGQDLRRLASVASFFVSRIDTAIDPLLAKNGSDEALALSGKAAVANARLAYERHLTVLAEPRWAALAAAGAQPQRPLWASTSTKNPDYDDTMYVVDLIASGCVNTMPEPTLHAVSDHGRVTGDTITPNLADARAVIDGLATAGVDYDAVINELEVAGVDAFIASWEQLLVAMATALATATGTP